MPETQGHFFALMLLIEFKPPTAFPVVIEAISLPGEAPFDLFGDTIHEDLSTFLASTVGDRLHMIDEIISNRSLDEFVRWAAASVYFDLVRLGLMDRELAADRLIFHLNAACDNEDSAVAGPLVNVLSSFAPAQALEAIERAFQLDLVEDFITNLNEVHELIAKGEEHIQQEFSQAARRDFTDVVEEMSSWHAYRGQLDEEDDYDADADYSWHPEDFDSEDEFDFDEDLPPAFVPAGTIVNTIPRIGRNELCPCGSGKKYKKCCGGKG